jgi:TPR repeat protein
MRTFAFVMLFCLAFVANEICARSEEGKLADRRGNYEKSFKELNLLANGGDASAQLAIGMMHDHGQGVQRSPKKAAKWYFRAAKQGNPTAQYNLGVMYSGGYGVQQNDKLAIKLFRLSAEAGNIHAQSILGASYSIPRGVKQDYVESRKWYLLAANQGDPDAQSYLGSMSVLGLGAAQDFEQAVRWYRLASDQGNASAQGELGVMYANGSGVLKNRIVACALFNLSLLNRVFDAERMLINRNNLIEEMTASEIEESNTLTSQMAIFGNLLKALDSYVNAPTE